MKPCSSLIHVQKWTYARQNTLTVLSWISVSIGKRNTKETVPTAWE